MSRVVRMRNGRQMADSWQGVQTRQRRAWIRPGVWLWQWSFAALAVTAVVEAVLAARLLVQVFAVRGPLADLAYMAGGFFQGPFAGSPEQLVRTRGIFEPETILAMVAYAGMALAVPALGLTLAILSLDWAGGARRTYRFSAACYRLLSGWIADAYYWSHGAAYRVEVVGVKVWRLLSRAYRVLSAWLARRQLPARLSASYVQADGWLDLQRGRLFDWAAVGGGRASAWFLDESRRWSRATRALLVYTHARLKDEGGHWAAQVSSSMSRTADQIREACDPDDETSLPRRADAAVRRAFESSRRRWHQQDVKRHQQETFEERDSDGPNAA